MFDHCHMNEAHSTHLYYNNLGKPDVEISIYCRLVLLVETYFKGFAPFARKPHHRCFMCGKLSKGISS